MRRIVLLVTLVCVVAASWIYLRSSPYTAVEPIAPVATPREAAHSAELVSLARPEDPIEREATSVAPAPPEPVPVVAMPARPSETDPHAIDLLKIEEQRLRTTLKEITTPLLVRKYQDGQATFLNAEQTYTAGPGDNEAIFAIHMDPWRGAFRTDIARDERPDLYVMKDRANAIRAEIAQLERERAVAAAANAPK